MIILVCYDVDTTSPTGAKRLKRIAQVCKDFGVRVQYSLFECRIEAKDWVLLRSRLLAEINETEDSLRIYFMDAGDAARTEHHGVRKPLDVQGPLVV